MDYVLMFKVLELNLVLMLDLLIVIIHLLKNGFIIVVNN